MKIRSAITALLLFSFWNNPAAQTTNFGIDAGFGTYEMTQVKQSLETVIKANALNPQCTHNFPGYLFFRPYMEFVYGPFNTGLSYTLMSTGARYSIRDYSGEYKLDAQIIGNTAGLYIENPVYTTGKFIFLLSAEGGVIFNWMKMKESYEVYDIVKQQSSSYRLTSLNMFLKPYIKVEYKIRKKLKTAISIGYHKDVHAKPMHLEGAPLQVTDFKADWDGFRAGIGITYCPE